MSYGLEIIRANGKKILTPDHWGGVYLGHIIAIPSVAGSHMFTGTAALFGKPVWVNVFQAGAHTFTPHWDGQTGNLIVSWTNQLDPGWDATVEYDVPSIVGVFVK